MTAYPDISACPVRQCSSSFIESKGDVSQPIPCPDNRVLRRTIYRDALDLAQVDNQSTVVASKAIGNVAVLLNIWISE